MERFSLKKLHEVEDKEEQWAEISNRFAAWENLDDDVDSNRLGTITISKFQQRRVKVELTKHNPWFDEGCSDLSDRRNQA
jgi:hypothetical protein